MMTPTGRHNYYEILELSTSAAQHEVTTAYERARVTYTGENPAIYTIFSEHEARELLTLIEEAYAVLGNKTLRTIYDQRLFGGTLPSSDLSYQSILTASKTLFPEAKKEEKAPAYVRDEKIEAEIKSRDEWNGESLRKIREYKGVDITRMADKTKINSYYITAIENMDPKNLPALVFVRGYVIQMSKLLGLNDKLVADSYMKAYKAKNG